MQFLHVSDLLHFEALRLKTFCIKTATVMRYPLKTSVFLMCL